MSKLLEFFNDMRDNGYGLAEIAAQLGTSAIAEPVAGFAAMYDPQNGAEAIREGMTYQPRSEAAKMYQQGAAKTLGAIAKPAMPVIDAWQRGVDIAGRYSPMAGAALQTVPTALGVALGAKPALEQGRQLSNSLGSMQARMVANATAPRTLNTGYMGQRGAMGLLDSLNPTGGVFVDYNPAKRANAKLADNIVTYDKTAGGSPEDLITIYRGLPKDKKNINSGDFVTTNKQLAKDYAGDGHVISMTVKKSDLLDDINEPLSEEYIYRKSISNAQRPLTEFEQAHLTAQRNAALPVEKGGLGLAPDNTAMDRARALGFDVDNPVYHGTGADFDKFNDDLLGTNTGAPSARMGHFFSETPHTASQYARMSSKVAIDDYNIFEDVLKKQIEQFNSIKGLPDDFKIQSLDDIINRKEIFEKKREFIRSAKKGSFFNKEENAAFDRIGKIESQWDNVYFNANIKNNKILQEKYGDDYRALVPRTGAKILPIFLRKGENYLKDFDGRMYRDEKFSDLMKKAKDSQYDSVTFANTFDPADIDLAKNPENIYAVFDPKNIRSRFAAFDPFNRESSNLLATTAPLVPTTALGAYMYNENRKKSQGKQ